MNALGKLDVEGKLNKDDREQFRLWDSIFNSDPTEENRYNRALYLAKAYIVDEKFAPQIAERLTQMDMSVNRKVFSNIYRMRFDCKVELKKFEKPTLILHGAEDIVPIEAAETAHLVIPNSKLHIVENSAHYGWLDNPDSYFGALDQFIN